MNTPSDSNAGYLVFEVDNARSPALAWRNRRLEVFRLLNQSAEHVAGWENRGRPWSELMSELHDPQGLGVGRLYYLKEPPPPHDPHSETARLCLELRGSPKAAQVAARLLREAAGQVLKGLTFFNVPKRTSSKTEGRYDDYAGAAWLEAGAADEQLAQIQQAGGLTAIQRNPLQHHDLLQCVHECLTDRSEAVPLELTGLRWQTLNEDTLYRTDGDRQWIFCQSKRTHEGRLIGLTYKLAEVPKKGAIPTATSGKYKTAVMEDPMTGMAMHMAQTINKHFAAMVSDIQPEVQRAVEVTEGIHSM